MDLNQEENQDVIMLQNSKIKNDLELKWIMACVFKNVKWNST